MSTIKILENLGLTWDSVEVNSKVVFFESGYAQTTIPYEVWDREIPVLETADVRLFEKEEPVKQKEWEKWLKQDDHDTSDMEIEFNYKPLEYGSALRAEFSSFDQFDMVISKNRSRDYWVLATHDDIELKGFIVEAAILAADLSQEEAFPYLMALFHLNYFNKLSGAHGSDADFNDAINECEIIEGISTEAQQKARGYVTVLYEKIRDDEGFWKRL